MKKMFCTMSVMSLVGCASIMPAPISRIDSLPVVKIGDVPPNGHEYVLHVPANLPIPVNLNARGTLLKQEQSVVGSVSFSKDVYLYKYWSSYDRKNWENSHSLLKVSFDGGVDISGLKVNVSLDTK